MHARCACAGGGAPFAFAGTERQYERARPFVVRHLNLELELDFADKSVSGTARLDFERVAPDADDLLLDAVGFELESVRLLHGERWSLARYDYDGNRLSIAIRPGIARGSVEVVYRARPRRGLYFLGPDSEVPERPQQVWTQCQDEDARHFVPCQDKPHVKMTTELAVTVPEGFIALSNGELKDARRPKGKPWRYHFALDRPHSSYLLTLVAGRFAVIEDRPAERGDGLPPVPVHYYVPPGRERDGRRSFAETPRIIELFGRLTGVAFPWSRYSQVVVSDFIFGGMENTTATTMYEYILLDERAAIDVTSNDLVAHELAHQWFGDYITCRDWSHAWLNEGFATFFEHVEREDRLGRDEYDYGVAGDLDAYLKEASGRYSRPMVSRDYEAPIDLFDRHLYEKGGLVLHMLRRELGDELFWQGVHSYLTRHAGGIVETNDLQRALEEVSGRSFERFFDQWVYRPGHPKLQVKVSFEDGLLSVQARQTQKTPDTATFAYRLMIEVREHGGATSRHEKLVTAASDTLVVRLAERPEYVAFDPELRIAGDVTVEAPADLLRRQLEKGSSARVRWAAAEALARRDDAPSIRALEASLASEKEAWMVRAEAAHALARIRGPESYDALARHVRARHPKVRRAVAAALAAFRTPEAAKLLSKLGEKDPSYVVQAEALRSLGRTRQPGALATLLALVDRASWADVTRAGALDGLGSLRDDEAVPHVMARTRYGIPSRGRRAAIAALARLSETRRVREHLEDLLDDADPHLRQDVVAALESLGEPRSRAALRRRLEHELDGRVARRIREALRNMSQDGVADRRRVNDEIETLRGELGELKARFAKLEGKKGKKTASEARSTARAAPPRRRRSRKSPKRAAERSAKRRKLLDERGSRSS